MFCTLYVSLVHPHLEYASEVWNPRAHLIGNIQVLEKVQNCATKLVPDLRQLTYSDRLASHFLYRRRRMDMITVFKLHAGADPDNFKRGALGARIKQKPRKVGRA